ncbi:MAG: flotillin family protein [Microscillaceae bacterium]
MGLLENTLVLGAIIAAIFIFGTLILFSRWYKKATQGQALIRTGVGGLKVSFNGMLVIPVLHRLEVMDISLKSFTLERMEKEGLICKDNMRADIKVTFFIKVNQKEEAVKTVAQSIGTARASDRELLIQLFDAKFSEALKTVGKRFDFEELYSERNKFKSAMLEEIGEELNGYFLEGAAIDYLEQTKIQHLNPENILDSQGIRKITELTAEQHKKTNQLQRDEEKEITRQNVEAKETVLDLERQLADKEANQRKDVASIKARTQSEIEKIEQEERLKAENARIITEEELGKAEERKEKEIIILRKEKEAIEARKTEEVEKERQIAATDREKAVELAQIEKTKNVEQDRRDIQKTIKERIELERETVIEQEKIKDTQAFANAERLKKVAILAAEQKAEEDLVKEIKAAEAHKKSAELRAEQTKLEAIVEREVVDKKAEAKKIMADADAEEAAALGLSEARVMEAKAEALRKQGEAEASIIKQKALAEADGIKATKAAENAAYEEKGKIDVRVLEEKGLAEANVIGIKADSTKKQGLAEAEVLERKGLVEADVMEKKAFAEAKKIEAKAEAMKKLDGVGKEHEEFKLKLEQETQLSLAKINIQKDIAAVQAQAMAEALKASKINIVGGETMFYENIMNAITRGRAFDSLIDSSEALTGLKDAVLNGQSGEGQHNLIERLKGFVSQFGLSANDLKNLTLSALLMRMLSMSPDEETKGLLNGMLNTAKNAGLLDKKASTLLS